ncbi:MAG: orotate phosphoribosyltransferase [Acidobacteria bacterium]|nr:orotate phosphoribosyltransferase [Acidobacteriota bacterium]
MSNDILRLVAGRPGHFRLESGHHSRLWLDLDTLFLDPARVRPFVNKLAVLLRSHDVDAVCGPLVGGALLAQTVAAALDLHFFVTARVVPADRHGLYPVRYVLPRTLRHRAERNRFAIVDDVISAGSAVRGTCLELEAHGAQPVVIGALLRLGDAATPFFAEKGVPVESVVQLPYDMWLPEDCPLCASQAPLEDVNEAEP